MTLDARPSINALRTIAAWYVNPSWFPDISYQELEAQEGGKSSMREGFIHISPKISLDSLVVLPGVDAMLTPIELRPGEQYVLTLLHEIGHIVRLGRSKRRILRELPLESEVNAEIWARRELRRRREEIDSLLSIEK